MIIYAIRKPGQRGEREGGMDGLTYEVTIERVALHNLRKSPFFGCRGRHSGRNTILNYSMRKTVRLPAKSTTKSEI